MTQKPHIPDVEPHAKALRKIETEIRKVIVGQDRLVERLLIGILSRGHLLIEGVPGLAKTLAVKTLAGVLDLDFRRVQFTPDLLPADLIGTLVFDQRQNRFVARKGPIFTQLLLADEINRAPAKVQSALLEVMEERQVTLGDRTTELAPPFMVLATQNPIEHEGTYPLSEAQIDRFAMKLILDYPEREDETAILDRMLVESNIHLTPQIDRSQLLQLTTVADSVFIDERVRSYVVDLVRATRSGGPDDEWIEFGASPRATLFLARSAKALAMLRGRGHVLPEDIKEVAPDVLRHRLVLTYEAQAEELGTDELVERLLGRVPVP